jgi:AraC-like DNA-binding protein
MSEKGHGFAVTYYNNLSFKHCIKNKKRFKHRIIMEKKEILCERIKSVITDLVENDEAPRLNMSVYISMKLQFNYTYLSNVFSALNDETIEQYCIRCKINKARLMLAEGVLARDIANRLHYSSNAHFSTQFKAVTGTSPSQYKRLLQAKKK